MELHQERARGALAAGQWIAAITHMAFARGFSFVRSIAWHDDTRDVQFVFEQHRWSSATRATKLRLDGRQLEGSRTAEYVGELLRMMGVRPPCEWEALGEWLARLMPLYRALPPARPEPACPTFDQLSTKLFVNDVEVKGLDFVLTEVPPTKPEHTVAGVPRSEVIGWPKHPRVPAPTGALVVHVPLSRGARPTFPPLLRNLVASLMGQSASTRTRLAAELEGVEQLLAEYHAELARDLFAGGKRNDREVVDLMLRGGLSIEHVARALRTMEEEDAEDEGHDELEVRVAELLEQGRRS